MNRKIAIAILAAALTAGVASFVLARTLAAPPAGSPVPRVITYEGNLDLNNVPATDDTYSFTFKFFDAETLGNQVGTTITQNVEVKGGRFVAQVSVGDDAVYETNPLYLEILVNTNKLAPRQKINATMFAVRAEKAEVAVRSNTVANPFCATDACSANEIVPSWTTVSITVGQWIWAYAWCPQTHPIPLTGGCRKDGGNPVPVVVASIPQNYERPADWSSSDQAKRAGWACFFKNNDTGTFDATALIYCRK